MYTEHVGCGEFGAVLYMHGRLGIFITELSTQLMVKKQTFQFGNVSFEYSKQGSLCEAPKTCYHLGIL